ncbi:DUF2209 domain-containing protein [Methanocella conradii]|uniref:DUF2209 domain-containing protein n=1 Tax=Methanocella conradii TaxID=1175444 RepID=UPI00157D5503|nr:DUF2209 domain-containing protein [Methanocella conradii]
MKAIAVDISGRHRLDDGRYHLVCVAVLAALSPFDMEKIEDMRIYKEAADDVSIDTIADLVKKACSRYKGIILAERERGEFYNSPEWRVEAILGRKFKYAESVGERKAIEVAHHVSLAVHRMLHERGNTGQKD